MEVDLSALLAEAGVQWDWEEVVTLRDKGVIKIVGTQTQTMALTIDGLLYVFGHKEYLGLSLNPKKAVQKHHCFTQFAKKAEVSNRTTS